MSVSISGLRPRSGAALAMAVASGLASAPAWACSCVPMDVPSSWFLNTDAYVVDVLQRVHQGDTYVYAARVKKAFKGCAGPGDTIAMVTPDDDISCGVDLTIGQQYLMFGEVRQPIQGRRTITVNLCNENKLVSQVTPMEHTYLLARPVVCQDTGQLTCANGTQPVQCFVDPCQYAPPCGPDNTCVPNTCHGGCDWEQYDAFGHLQCWGP